MKPSLNKLVKFFKLEAERGYDNRAVMGGLARILDSWEAEARNDGLSEELIQFIHTRLQDYPGMDEAGRLETLAELWQRLQEVSDGPLPPLPSPAKEEKSESPPPPPHAGAPTRLPEGATPDKAERPPQPARERPSVRDTGAETPAALNAPTTVLPNVGPRHAQTLSRLGLHTLYDMLYYFPRRYVDYTQLKPINRLWYG